ncbi:hypothetical protein JCM6882_007236 [Rhodosporidiobolus microsporus]
MLGFHHFGTFLLFAASILLIVATITAPVVNNIALAKASFTVGSTKTTVNLGTLGYCILVDGSSDSCSSTGVGYEIPPVLVALATSTGVLSDSAEDAINAVTKALVLHPVAAGVSFFAAIVAGCSDRLGFLCAALIAVLAAVLALICMVLDLVFFYVVRKWLRDNDLDVDVSYSYGTWLTVAAFAALFVGVFATACACLSDRKKRRRQYNEKW